MSHLGDGDDLSEEVVMSCLSRRVSGEKNWCREKLGLIKSKLEGIDAWQA